jgi:hypothetical protein
MTTLLKRLFYQLFRETKERSGLNVAKVLYETTSSPETTLQALRTARLLELVRQFRP